MRKRNCILICAVSLLMLFFIAGTLIKPDTYFAEDENRYLTQVPKLSVRTLLSGDFEEDSEKYLSDQIIGRSRLVRLMSAVSTGLGIRDVNGVYKLADYKENIGGSATAAVKGRLVQQVKPSDFDKERYSANLEQFRALSEASEIPVYVMLVPTAQYVYSEHLPKNAPVFDEDKAFEEAKDLIGDSFIDIRDAMKQSTPAIEDRDGAYTGGKYFLSDHHWTAYGASIGYDEFIRASAPEKAAGKGSYYEFGMKTLTESFKGTLYSRALPLKAAEDRIEVPEITLGMKMKADFDGEKYDSIYFPEKLEEKDKYTVYLGGNYAKADIDLSETDGVGADGKRLLILKDSYANSFVPFLIASGDYSVITMIDTRYYRESISELSADYDEVLALYSISNFAEERINLKVGKQ